MPLLEGMSDGQKKALTMGAPVVAAFALAMVMSKRSQAATAATAQAAPPVQLMAAPTGADASLGSSFGDFQSGMTSAFNQLSTSLQEQLSGLSSAIGNDAANKGSSNVGTPPSAGYVPVGSPWKWGTVDGSAVLVDAATGKPAHYGPQGQPGWGWSPGQPIRTGTLTWLQPDGRWAEYDPNSWAYGDPSRPMSHPVPLVTTSAPFASATPST